MLAKRCYTAVRSTSPRNRALQFATRWSPSVWHGLVAASIVLIALPKALDDHRSEQAAGRRAAEWLRAQSMPAGRVASLRSRLGYYADREWEPLAIRGELRPLQTLNRFHVRYVIAEEALIADGPDPLDLLREESGHALRELTRVETAGRRAFVFELVESNPQISHRP